MLPWNRFRPVKQLGEALLLTVFFAVPAAARFDVETVSLDTVSLRRYLDAEAEKLTREAAARIDSREKIEAERDRLHREFLFMLGLDPLPPRTDLQATRVRTVERKEYTIEVLYFQSLPRFYVTANVYVPKKGNKPFPAVIFGPGHSIDEYGGKALLQNYAIPWVRNGYICMIVDPIQVAEVFGVHRGVSCWDLRDWYARGYTPIGIEVWDAMRAVDYLLTRPDVDGSRLTISGVSGGGHLSWMAGAADERFVVVQPAAGTSDIHTHITRDLQSVHCDCAYFINAYRHDWPTLAALIAPRSLLMHNSVGDSYYPPEGYKRVLARSKEIFGWFGVPEKVDMVEVEGPHGYSQAQREKAVEWSDRRLKGIESEVHEAPFEKVPGEQLAAFGGVFGEHPPNINAQIQELLIPRARLECYDNLAAWERRRAEVLDELRTVVFRNMPRRQGSIQKVEGDNGSYVIETETGIRVGMSSTVPQPKAPRKKAILAVASPGDTQGRVLWGFMRANLLPGVPASRHMVYPRGIGREVWDAVVKKKFERSVMLLGRTLDDMRLYDVLCAVDYLASQPAFAGTELTVVGKGEAGILGAYAALLDPRISRVILFNPPLSHEEGPIFLNVLRYTDIPQILAMLAPRELVFLTREIDYFDYTRSIYKLYNAENNFRRAYTVPQALDLNQ